MTQDVSYRFLVEWYWRGQQGQHFSSVFMDIIKKVLLDTYFAPLSLEDLAYFHCSFFLLLSVTDSMYVYTGHLGKNSSKYEETLGVSYFAVCCPFSKI